MVKIGLLSDTHGYLNPRIIEFFKDCDQIWHAGDIGNLETADALSAFKPLVAVHGNIDGTQLRMLYPEIQVFTCENIKVVMKHIGGYPGRYDKSARQVIENEKPALFISGHSHILKVIYDQKHQLLHINPGAAGNSGIHQVVTAINFTIEGNEIKDLRVFELKRR